MSQLLYLSDERSISVGAVYGVSDDVPIAYEIEDVDRVQDVARDLWDLEFDTEKEALAFARHYIETLGLEVNQ